MSKSHTSFLILIAFWAVLPFCSTTAQTITEYYKLLADYDDDVKLHKLFEVKGQWYTQVGNNARVKAIVDIKNNFIELKDKEKDGIFTLQISLFKKANGEVLIAVVKNHFDYFLHGEAHILRLRNGRWNDITEEVLPEITYKDFVEQTVSLAESAFNPTLNHHLEFGYQLPQQQGSTAVALMQTQILKEKCKENDPSVKEYCASLSEISYSSIELVWDGKKGVFVLGEKK